MTSFEKRVAMGAAMIELFMLIFPPWQVTERGLVFYLGYDFIGAGPQAGEIDWGRLAIQVIVIGAIAFGVSQCPPLKR